MAGSFGREEQSSLLRETWFDSDFVGSLTDFGRLRSEGYDEYFDPPLESKFECPICVFGLREPAQTTCGNRFCKGYILRSIRDSGPKCPVDHAHLNESQLYPDAFAKREILSHEVFCRFKKQHGCPWKGPLKEIHDHLKDCLFVSINCPMGCGKQMKKKDLKQHIKRKCPKRTVPCNFCKEEVKWKKLENHYQDCPKYLQKARARDMENFSEVNGQVHVDEILAQCYEEYSSSNPLKVTILSTQWKGGSPFIRELARQLAKFPLLKVNVLVPENSEYSEQDKRKSQSLYTFSIVEAQEQPGFLDPIEWLNFPPADLISTDIVVGYGEKLSKIAQNWKKRNKCKSMHIVDCDNVRGHPPPSSLAQLKKETRRNVKNLCQVADIPVAIGPKTTDELSASLALDRKEVFNLTPGIISAFSNLTHADNDRGKFRVLLVGGDNPDNFQKEELDIAAKIVTELNDKSFLFIYVGEGEGRSMEQYAHKFHDECGVSKAQLEIRGLPKREEEWKRLFCEVDLAIMPSSEKEFGFEALFALSAGLPVLVHGESGFGEALKEVKFGTSTIVDSEDSVVWASEIKKVRKTSRKQRLEQAAELRSQYDRMYNWEEQCRPLVGMMLQMCSGQPEVSYV